MSRIICDANQTKLGIVTLDQDIPQDHICRFIVDFVEDSYDELEIEQSTNTVGRSAYSIKSLVKLDIYATFDNVKSADRIAEFAKYHSIYQFVCDGITPSASKIREFRREYRKYYRHLLELTLKKALDEDFTDFNHVACDGTPRKAHNNYQNKISKKEVIILLNFLQTGNLPDKDLNKLHSPALRILKRTDMSNQDKINLLLDIKYEFKNTRQDKIPINDFTARKMKNKKGNFIIGHNIQTAVDTKTSLICAVHVSSSPTDHYELPNIGKKAIENIGFSPNYMSADNIYLNESSLLFLVENGIDGLIKNRKQSKGKIKKLNANPFHKDHFIYIRELDAFLCPNNHYLYFYREYPDYNKLDKFPNAKQRAYRNYEACKNCPYRNKCFSKKQNHRIITESGSTLIRDMYFKMELEEYSKKYDERSRVEGPFGYFRTQYQFESDIITDIHYIEDTMNLLALVYNLKRLYNLKHGLNSCEDETSVNNGLMLTDYQSTLIAEI